MRISIITDITGRIARARLPGWAWFVLLWCAGVAGAMAIGLAFKVLMNLTLFAVAK